MPEMNISTTCAPVEATDILPVELWTRCFFLGITSKLDLQSLTLTCKLFCSIAQPFLFWSLDYCIPDPATAVAHWGEAAENHLRKAQDMIQLSRSPLRKAVKHLTLTDGSENGKVQSYFCAPQRTPSQREITQIKAKLGLAFGFFLEAAAAFVNLEAMVMDGVEISADFFNNRIKGLTKLTALSLCGAINAPIQASLPLNLFSLIVSDNVHAQPLSPLPVKIFRNDTIESVRLGSLHAMTQCIDGVVQDGLCPRLTTLYLGALDSQSFQSFIALLPLCPNLTHLHLMDDCGYVKGVPYQSRTLAFFVVPNLVEYQGPTQFLELFMRGQRQLRRVSTMHSSFAPLCYPPCEIFFSKHFIPLLEDTYATAKLTKFDVGLVPLPVAHDILRLAGKNMPALENLLMCISSCCQEHIGGVGLKEACSNRTYPDLIYRTSIGEYALPKTLRALTVLDTFRGCPSPVLLTQAQQHRAVIALGNLYPQLERVKLGQLVGRGYQIEEGVPMHWVRCRQGSPWLKTRLERLSQARCEYHAYVDEEDDSEDDDEDYELDEYDEESDEEDRCYGFLCCGDVEGDLGTEIF